jgi:hypothetical protein
MLTSNTISKDTPSSVVCLLLKAVQPSSPIVQHSNRGSGPRIDETSVIEKKPEIEDLLNRRLSNRPDKKVLRDHNILQSLDLDPSLHGRTVMY